MGVCLINWGSDLSDASDLSDLSDSDFFSLGGVKIKPCDFWGVAGLFIWGRFVVRGGGD